MRQSIQEIPSKDQEAFEENIDTNRPVKILFVGDMMFDRYIRESVEKYGNGDYGYPLAPVKEYLSDFDLVVGNLEGPITNKSSTSTGTAMGARENLVFTFDPAAAGALARNNIRIVNLGNNHVLNQGGDGLTETKKFLDESGVKYFDEVSTLVRSFGDIKVGFVGYNYTIAKSLENSIGEIQELKKKVDFVFVCPHWGTEYKTGDPGIKIRNMARAFIEAGADAVIGTHPHVIQTVEFYGDKKIYYSLGNFVFDQYFQKETMEGLGLEMTISTDGVLEYNEARFVMNRKGQTLLDYNRK